MLMGITHAWGIKDDSWIVLSGAQRQDKRQWAQTEAWEIPCKQTLHK